MSKKESINVKGVEIIFFSQQKDAENYIYLTDIVRYRNTLEPFSIINNWMQSRNTIEFLGLWEILNEAGSNYFVLSPQRWIEQTNVSGTVSEVNSVHKPLFLFNFNNKITSFKGNAFTMSPTIWIEQTNDTDTVSEVNLVHKTSFPPNFNNKTTSFKGNAFTMSSTRWIEQTNVSGTVSKVSSVHKTSFLPNFNNKTTSVASNRIIYKPHYLIKYESRI